MSMAVAFRAGQPERAMEHLSEYIRAARGVDYTRPLVRHSEISRAVLRQLLATDLDQELRTFAESLLELVGDSSAVPTSLFSTRELEVLAEAGRGLRNREIAVRLGITDEGVRYHLKNIYRKTGASKRADALLYARSVGALA